MGWPGPHFGRKGPYVKRRRAIASLGGECVNVRIEMKTFATAPTFINGQWSSRMRYPLVVVAMTAFVCEPAYAQTDKSQIIAECDRLAAIDVDPDRPSSIPGIPVNAIDAAAAVPACEAAVVVAGEDRRIIFQLGRAYGAAKLYEK